MKKVLVGLMTGLLCIMPAAGVMAEEAAAETANEAQALSDDIYSFQAEIDGEIYQFPMSFSEFTAKGWTYDGDAAQTLEPEQYTTAETFKKDSSKLYAPCLFRSLQQKGGLTMETLRRRLSRSSIQQQRLLRRIPQSCMLLYLIWV